MGERKGRKKGQKIKYLIDFWIQRYHSIAQYDKKAAPSSSSHHGSVLSVLGQFSTLFSLFSIQTVVLR